MANNQLLASDSFASGSLAAGWSAVPTKTLGVITASAPYYAEASGLSTVSQQIFTGISWPEDQISEMTIQTLTAESGSLAYLAVRISNSAFSGYQANLNNGTALIVRYDNGTPTQVGSTVTGLTIAAGDVWMLQAAGSVISLYQNSKRILFVADTTYTSGYPGFGNYSSVNVTHSQTASWRGYNAVQQDGIWQKQGIVLAARSSDLASSGFGVFQPCVFWDTNAQILSGTVLKMWFSGGGTTANIYYAESTDGKSWSIYASAVLSGYANGIVVKYSGTYYMFCQPSASQGSGNIALYTSSDGLSWTQQSTNILAPGGSGAWDNAHFYMLCPPVLLGGTWYMLYTGANASGLYSLGIATASSLTGTWTKYASNPVLSKGAPETNVVLVNGVYYTWLSSGPTSGTNQFNPTQAIRYQSTDLLSWSNPVHSLHSSQLFESINANTGQCAPCSIVDVGGKAYFYTISAPNDGSAPQDYQIGLSIAPTSIANLVLQSEDGTQQVARDGFTSGTGNLSANWSTPTGGTKLQIIAGNIVEGTATNTVCLMAYTGASFSSNQYSEITVQTMAASSYLAAYVRMQTGAKTLYGVNLQGPTGSANAFLQVIKVVSGTQTTIGPAISVTPAVGDVFRTTVIDGSDGNPIISIFQNGVQLLQVEDYGTPITGGYPGMATYSATLTNAQISAWTGGNANVIPSYLTAGTEVSNPVPVTVVNAAGFSVGMTGATIGAHDKAPSPICLVDSNGNELSISGGTIGAYVGGPTPVAFCDSTGHAVTPPFSISSGSGSLAIGPSLTGNKLGSPVPIMITDDNGNYLSGSDTVGILLGNPTPVALRDVNGNSITIAGV